MRVADEGPVFWCDLTIGFACWTGNILVFPSADEFSFLVQRSQFGIVIKKAVLTIGVENTTRFVGSANHAFVLTYDGFVGPDAENQSAAIAALARLPVASTKATPKSNAGEYEITLAGGAVETYEFRLLKPEGKLTVIGFGGT